MNVIPRLDRYECLMFLCNVIRICYVARLYLFLFGLCYDVNLPDLFSFTVALVFKYESM